MPLAPLRMLAAAVLALGSTVALADPQLRCGWLDNPSPSNTTLIDRDGEWTIAQQGGHQAEGDTPSFKPSQWVKSGNGSYGHGCACLKVEVNADEKEIDRIVSAQARPLSACRKDRALKGKEPDLPPK